MRHRTKPSASILSDTRGLSTVEYVILLVLIVAVGLAAWHVFGGDVADRSEQSTRAIVRMQGGAGGAIDTARDVAPSGNAAERVTSAANPMTGTSPAVAMPDFAHSSSRARDSDIHTVTFRPASFAFTSEGSNGGSSGNAGNEPSAAGRATPPEPVEATRADMMGTAGYAAVGEYLAAVQIPFTDDEVFFRDGRPPQVGLTLGDVYEDLRDFSADDHPTEGTFSEEEIKDSVAVGLYTGAARLGQQIVGGFIAASELMTNPAKRRALDQAFNAWVQGESPGQQLIDGVKSAGTHVADFAIETAAACTRGEYGTCVSNTTVVVGNAYAVGTAVAGGARAAGGKLTQITARRAHPEIFKVEVVEPTVAHLPISTRPLLPSAAGSRLLPSGRGASGFATEAGEGALVVAQAEERALVVVQTPGSARLGAAGGAPPVLPEAGPVAALGVAASVGVASVAARSAPTLELPLPGELAASAGAVSSLELELPITDSSPVALDVQATAFRAEAGTLIDLQSKMERAMGPSRGFSSLSPEEVLDRTRRASAEISRTMNSVRYRTHIEDYSFSRDGVEIAAQRVVVDDFPARSRIGRIMRFMTHRYGDRTPRTVVEPLAVGAGGFRPSDRLLILSPMALADAAFGRLQTIKHELRHTRVTARDPSYPWHATYSYPAERAGPNFPPEYATFFSSDEMHTYLADLADTRADYARSIQAVRQQGRRALSDGLTRAYFDVGQELATQRADILRAFGASIEKDNARYLELLDRTTVRATGAPRQGGEGISQQRRGPEPTDALLVQYRRTANGWAAELAGAHADRSLTKPMVVQLVELPATGGLDVTQAERVLRARLQTMRDAVEHTLQAVDDHMMRIEELAAQRTRLANDAPSGLR